MKDIKIFNGDTVINPNGYPEMIDGFDEVVQRVAIALTVPKGSFAYDRNLGVNLSEKDFESDNIISTLESLINEAIINTDVYISVNGIRTENTNRYIGITVSDGVRVKETEVKILGQLQ